MFIHSRAFLPQNLGGLETTTFDLCRELALLGHQGGVMCKIAQYDRLWLRNRLLNRLTGRAFPRDSYEGIPVYRGHGHLGGLPQVIEDFRPDALVVAGGSEDTFEFARACVCTGLPSFLYFHELRGLRRMPGVTVPPELGLITNSQYTAGVVRELLGRDSVVIPPLVDRAAYETPTSRRFVTMVNPRKIKGGETALALVKACSDIPFLFVEAWQGGDEYVASLRAAARRIPNLTWRAPTTDMRSIYAETAIMLVPSDWEETWGRVATEAHASGIPVLARAVAGVPEAVGPGGILIAPRAPLEDWVRALRSMWDDAAFYDSLVARVREYSARVEMQPRRLAQEFVAALQSKDAPIPSTGTRP